MGANEAVDSPRALIARNYWLVLYYLSVARYRTLSARGAPPQPRRSRNHFFTQFALGWQLWHQTTDNQGFVDMEDTLLVNVVSNLLCGLFKFSDLSYFQLKFYSFVWNVLKWIVIFFRKCKNLFYRGSCFLIIKNYIDY